MSSADASADTRLAAYGTLAPGRVNHRQLRGLAGRWRPGTVRGWLHETGWGATFGFPGLVLDETGPVVEVQLFESADLPHHWARLDAFEGREYRRVVARVRTADGDVPAWIYVVAAGRPPVGAR
jgi:gamma-glutamylcyclotransferase (GGCT)/AIG2-like uncharacterized protein YtfP